MPRLVHALSASSGKRVGVLDIGSNSVRLVVFEGGHRMPIPIFNEKALCGLAAEIQETGRLSKTGRISAIVNIRRFIEISREMELSSLDVLATAAVRDAENGPEFVSDLESRFNCHVRVLSGDDEAKLSALGVISAYPEAEGVMGDLGGGSLELVDISSGFPRQFATMPLGPLRLGEMSTGNRTSLRHRIDHQLTALPWLDRLHGRSLYAVGGAWRSLARAHMAEIGYPLNVIHGYEMGSSDAVKFFDRLSYRPTNTKSAVPGVSRRRMASIALAALILSRVLSVGKVDRLVFSAFGLREGCLYDALGDDEKTVDPLLASCAEIAAGVGRFPLAPRAVERWAKGFLPGLNAREERLSTAISILSDLAWAEHPGYRDEHAFHKVLRLPVVGLNHEERVFIALAILARYSGGIDHSCSYPVVGMVSKERRKLALTIGLALRLGLTLCGGVSRLLGEIEVSLHEDRISIIYPWDMAVVHGDSVGRRAEALAEALGKPVVLEPRAKNPDSITAESA